MSRRPRTRVESWVDRGFAGGALLGLLEGAERAYAVREFVRTPAELVAFAALAFSFCLGTGIVIGLLAGAIAAIVDAAGRSSVPRGVARALFGAGLGLGAAVWLLFALTLTVRFDPIVRRSSLVIAAAMAAGAVASLAWPLLAAVWRHPRVVRPPWTVAAVLLGGLLVALHLWNAHFAPQSSLGIHVLADTVLAGTAFAIVSLIPGGLRGRARIVALAAAAGLLVWTDHTMRNHPVLENLLKTRGSISAHAVRMWSAVMDLDGDGHAPALLVGGEDPDNFDSGVPPPLLRAAAAFAEPAGARALVVAERGASGAAGAPHLVLLTLDACRLDVVPPYTAERSRLGALLPPRPALERLARRVARFSAGYTPSAGTEDTFAALFSGWDLPGILNGVPEARTLEARLGAAGYAVRGFVNDPHFAVSAFRSKRLIRYGRGDSPRMLRDAAAFLDSLPAGQTGFAWIHVMDLHADLLEPFARETFSHRAHLEHYARDLARVDSMVGDFIGALDTSALAGHTLLVMTADHGEELRGHGHYHHNLSLYQPAIEVPLWIMGPGVVAGERAAKVSLQGLYPTLLEAGGQEPGDTAGRSLWPMLRGTGPGSSDSLIYSFLPQRGFSQRYAHFQRPELGQAMLLDAVRGHKVILRLGLGSWEAYDVASDSMERENLAGGSATWPDSLRRRLEQMIQERGTPGRRDLRAPRAELGPGGRGSGWERTGVVRTVARMRHSAPVGPRSGP